MAPKFTRRKLPYNPKDYAAQLAIQRPELSSNQIFAIVGGRKTDVRTAVAEARGIVRPPKEVRVKRSTPTKFLNPNERGARIRSRINAMKKRIKTKKGQLPEGYQPRYKPGEVEFLAKLRSGEAQEEYDSFYDEEAESEAAS